MATAWASHDAQGARSAPARPSTAQGWSLSSTRHFRPGGSSWGVPGKMASREGDIPAGACASLRLSPAEPDLGLGCGQQLCPQCMAAMPAGLIFFSSDPPGHLGSATCWGSDQWGKAIAFFEAFWDASIYPCLQTGPHSAANLPRTLGLWSMHTRCHRDVAQASPSRYPHPGFRLLLQPRMSGASALLLSHPMWTGPGMKQYPPAQEDLLREIY